MQIIYTVFKICKYIEKMKIDREHKTLADKGREMVINLEERKPKYHTWTSIKIAPQLIYIVHMGKFLCVP